MAVQWLRRRWDECLGKSLRESMFQVDFSIGWETYCLFWYPLWRELWKKVPSTHPILPCFIFPPSEYPFINGININNFFLTHRKDHGKTTMYFAMDFPIISTWLLRPNNLSTWPCSRRNPVAWRSETGKTWRWCYLMVRKRSEIKLKIGWYAHEKGIIWTRAEHSTGA